MLSQSEIDQLISERKRIVRADPTHGMRPDDKYERRTLYLASIDEERQYEVFIRRNCILIEDFSVGLIYKSNRKEIGNVMLIRFNGSHGQSDWSADGHYSAFHIHSLTQDLLEKGIREPKRIQLTDRYSTLEDALGVFFEETGVENWPEYFSELKQLCLNRRW